MALSIGGVHLCEDAISSKAKGKDPGISNKQLTCKSVSQRFADPRRSTSPVGADTQVARRDSAC